MASPSQWTRFVIPIALLLCVANGCRTTAWSQEKQTIYRLDRHLNSWRVLVQYSVADVHKAVLAALHDLQLKPITDQADKISAVVDGMFADNMDYEIKMEALAPRLTRLTIKCGMFGNKARAKLLFDATQKHL